MSKVTARTIQRLAANRTLRVEKRLAKAERLLREAAAILIADTDQRRRDEFSCTIDAFLRGTQI